MHAGCAHVAAPPLIAALSRPECYPHPVSGVRVLETHISWVLLTGVYAYKIKKPVNLGFLDFTTLAARRHYCEEELRLNRRLAPELYLGIVEIRGSAERPRLGGEGPVLDYAVQMREFPQEALARWLIKCGRFGAEHVDPLAADIGRFHAAAAVASPADRFGSPEAVLKPARQNFEQLAPRLTAASDQQALSALAEWTEGEFAARHAAFQARKERGFVRECHGDLHLGNIAVIRGRPVPFDCIEFNDELRWIDVMSEVAFLMMDFEDRRRGDLAWRFLNRYLEATGDYAGLSVFRFYLVYRALVRAKVHLMRARQPRIARTEKVRLTHACHDYLRLAARLAETGAPAMLITHGLSGSGKTTGTQSLIELLGAVRLRSDIERKRLHGLEPLARSGSAPGAGIYTREATAATYRHLAGSAGSVLAAGYPVVVDAAFLTRAERDRFQAVAAEHQAPFLILDFQVPEAVLRERIAARARQNSDASEADLAILERQLAAQEPLAEAEARYVITVTQQQDEPRTWWRPVLERLPGAAMPARAVLI